MVKMLTEHILWYLESGNHAVVEARVVSEGEAFY